jgi:hypothetical protein
MNSIYFQSYLGVPTLSIIRKNQIGLWIPGDSLMRPKKEVTPSPRLEILRITSEVEMQAGDL